MKILILNPQIDAEHKILKLLEANGVATILSSNPVDAWKLLKLHGRTIDLAIVHREGMAAYGEDSGLDFISQFKQDPAQQDLPYILTTEKWTDGECAQHQNSFLGGNAYLRVPLEPNRLLEVISQITGRSFTVVQPPAASPLEASGGIKIEEPSLLAPGPEDEALNAELASSAGSLAIELESSEKSLSLVESLKSLPPARKEEPSLGVIDEQVAQEMPYLFDGPERRSKPRSAEAPEYSPFSQPIGDAVVPGGAAQSPDAETFKKYLLLREQDVATLSAQLHSAHEEIANLRKTLQLEKARSGELEHTIEELGQKVSEFEMQKVASNESLLNENQDLKFKLKSRIDKGRILELKVKEALEEKERIKERVRNDIRKIRMREKELENRLEILKRDSEAILTSRENKIIELKRKMDMLEFNLDILQDQNGKEREKNQKLKEKVNKAAQAMRLAGGFLDDPDKKAELEGLLEPDEKVS